MSKIKSGSILKIILPSLMTFFFIGNQIYSPKWTMYLQNIIFDQYQNLSPRIDTEKSVFIVDIDDDSLEKLGQWPWPRFILSDLIKILNDEYQVAAIGFDILFSEKDRLSPSIVFEQLAKNNLNLSSEVINTLEDFDKIFADTIKEAKNIVLAISLNTKPNNNEYNEKASFSFLGGNPKKSLIKNYNLISNLNILTQKAKGQGFINSSTDIDGIVRKVPVISNLTTFDNKTFIVPSFGSELLRVAQNSNSYLIKSTEVRSKIIPLEIKNKNFIHKIDKEGNTRINFSNFNKNRLIPATEILGKTYRNSLKNKIIIIGSSASGLKDSVVTPLQSNIIGSEIHAQYIENIINNDFLDRPDYVYGLEISLTLTLSLIVIVIIFFNSALISTISSLTIIIFLGIISWLLFKNFNILIDPTLTIFSCIGNWMILTSILYFNEQKEKIFLRNAFGRYLSPVMVEKITQNPDQLKLTGDNKIITVMFCDIRNFTKISEDFQSRPKELTSLINSILDPLTKIILKQNGTIDKYMGDCIMAFWNAPLKNEKHCEDALVCSLEMIECVEKLNLDFKSKFGIEGIGIGIGINTGLATVGNMGSNIRLDYSIIGDCVNLGARLEGHSKELGVPIVIGENVLNNDYFKINSKEFLSEFQIFELDNIALKGKKEATKCYTLIPHSNKLKKSETEIHYKFLDQYYEGRFKEAIVTLTHLIGLNNYLVNYYNLMKDRCLSFDKERINNWDGITKSNKK